MSEKIFITGASGFIGSNLSKKLVDSGYEISLLLHKNSHHPFIDKLNNAEKIVGDITDKHSIKNAMKGCDVVFHSAAKISFNRYDYNELYIVNVEGTRNVLEVALELGIKKVIHISACAVLGYSKNKDTVLNESSNPVIYKKNAYAYTKKLAEEEVKRFCDKGLNAVVANLSTVYGEGDVRLNSGTIIKAIYKNKLKVIPPGGTSVVSVKDVVDGLILLIEKGRKGERYIFSNETMEYIEACNIIVMVLNSKKIKYKLPKILYYPVLVLSNILEFFLSLFNINSILITSQIVKESFGYKYFSHAKATKELGWIPKVCFSNTVKDAFEFYKETKLIQ